MRGELRAVERDGGRPRTRPRPRPSPGGSIGRHRPSVRSRCGLDRPSHHRRRSRDALAMRRAARQVTLEKLELRAATCARSPAPPRATARSSIAGSGIRIGLSASRPATDGAVKLRLMVDTVDQPRMADRRRLDLDRARHSAFRRRRCNGSTASAARCRRRRPLARHRPRARQQRGGGGGEGRVPIRPGGARRCGFTATPT